MTKDWDNPRMGGREHAEATGDKLTGCLRLVRREVLVMEDDWPSDAYKDIRVLQQEWIRPNGSTYWADVPMAEDEA